MPALLNSSCGSSQERTLTLVQGTTRPAPCPPSSCRLRGRGRAGRGRGSCWSPGARVCTLRHRALTPAPPPYASLTRRRSRISKHFSWPRLYGDTGSRGRHSRSRGGHVARPPRVSGVATLRRGLDLVTRARTITMGAGHVSSSVPDTALACIVSRVTCHNTHNHHSFSSLLYGPAGGRLTQDVTDIV